jgi:hypothetical protein
MIHGYKKMVEVVISIINRSYGLRHYGPENENKGE